MKNKKITHKESEQIRSMVNSGISKRETARRLNLALSTIHRHSDKTRKEIPDHVKKDVVDMYVNKGMYQKDIAIAVGLSKTMIHRLLVGYKRFKTESTTKRKSISKPKDRKVLPVDKIKAETKHNPDKIRIKSNKGMKRHDIGKGLWVEIDANASCDEVKKIIDRKRKVYGIL